MTYIVHRPKHYTVTLTWDIEADSREEAESKVCEVVEQVGEELEEVKIEGGIIMKIYTQEEVAQFIEDIRKKLKTRAREESATSDGYLDDPGDRGLKHYWYHRGKASGFREAIKILTRIAIENYYPEGKE